MKAKKALGQNFISDPQLISDIVDASGCGEKDTVVEIGPGRGALTQELAGRVRKLYAVELDSDLIPVLRTIFALKPNVEIINEDILTFDFSKVTEDLKNENDGYFRIIGNLPYYITTPIILGLLEQAVPAKTMTFMVQKEVAERIVAGPGRDFGVLSVSVQYYCDAEYMLDVPAEYFNPRPKVDSAVVRLTPKKERLLQKEDEKLFFDLVKAAFSQRRKTLSNCLSGFNGIDKESLLGILENCGINPQRRPETLSLEEFAALTRAVKSK